MSNADKQKRYRARQKAGLRVLGIAVSEDDVAEAVRRGKIDIHATEHDPDLEEAIAEASREWVYEQSYQRISVTRNEPAETEVTIGSHQLKKESSR